MIDWKDKIKEVKTLLGARITASDKELQIMQTAALMSIAESLKNFNYMKLGDIEVGSTYDDEYGEDIIVETEPLTKDMIDETINKLKSNDNLETRDNKLLKSLNKQSENKHEEKQNESNDNRGNGHDKPNKSKQQRK